MTFKIASGFENSSSIDSGTSGQKNKQTAINMKPKELIILVSLTKVMVDF